MKKTILLILLSVLALTGCHTTKTIVVVQKEYIAVGVADSMTRTEQIPALPVTKEEYVAAKPKEREEILANQTRSLTSLVHILNGRLVSIANLVKTQTKLIAEENERAKKEADEQKERK